MALEVGKALSLESGRGHLRSIQVQTHSRIEFKDVTSEIQKLIADSGVRSGVCYVFTPHTSAAVLIQAWQGGYRPHCRGTYGQDER